jgi:hypothetical protein
LPASERWRGNCRRYARLERDAAGVDWKVADELARRRLDGASVASITTQHFSRTANRAAHTRAKPAVLDLQRPSLCKTRTLRWRKADSNSRSHFAAALRLPRRASPPHWPSTWARPTGFAVDSPLEGNGFELSVPRRESNESHSGTGTVTEATKVRLEAVAYFPGTDGSNPFPSKKESVSSWISSRGEKGSKRRGYAWSRLAHTH